MIRNWKVLPQRIQPKDERFTLINVPQRGGERRKRDLLKVKRASFKDRKISTRFDEERNVSQGFVF